MAQRRWHLESATPVLRKNAHKRSKFHRLETGPVACPTNRPLDFYLENLRSNHKSEDRPRLSLSHCSTSDPNLALPGGATSSPPQRGATQRCSCNQRSWHEPSIRLPLRRSEYVGCDPCCRGARENRSNARRKSMDRGSSASRPSGAPTICSQAGAPKTAQTLSRSSCMPNYSRD